MNHTKHISDWTEFQKKINQLEEQLEDIKYLFNKAIDDNAELTAETTKQSQIILSLRTENAALQEKLMETHIIKM